MFMQLTDEALKNLPYVLPQDLPADHAVMVIKSAEQTKAFSFPVDAALSAKYKESGALMRYDEPFAAVVDELSQLGEASSPEMVAELFGRLGGTDNDGLLCELLVDTHIAMTPRLRLVVYIELFADGELSSTLYPGVAEAKINDRLYLITDTGDVMEAVYDSPINK